MLKSLDNAIRRNKEPYLKTDKSVQDFVAITKVYEHGIFLHENNVYSASFIFNDINFSVLGIDEKEKVFKKYCELINTFDDKATTKITINNRKLDFNYLKKSLCIDLEEGNKNDEYRAEYNQMLVQAIQERKSLVQEKYITISIVKPSIQDAISYFNNLEKKLTSNTSPLVSIKSGCRRLSTNERLKILHDFYRQGEEGFFNFDAETSRGTEFKDYICADYCSVKRNYVRLSEKKFSRALFIRADKYPNKFTDDFVSYITDVDKELMLSIDVVPIPVDEAVTDANGHLLSVETNITRWQGSQNKNFNFSADVPQQYDTQRTAGRDFLAALTEADLKEFQVVLTVVVSAPSLDELNSLVEDVVSKAKEKQVQLSYCEWKQLDGIKTCLPIGVTKLDKYRTLLTTGVGILMPFRVQDMWHEGGTYYGRNEESGSIIRLNKFSFQNGNSMIFGVPGSGKSFKAKSEMISYMLRGDCDVIVVDPQGEYGRLFDALGGENIILAPNSPSSINLLDINEEYREEGGTPIALKSDFMIAFCEQACEGITLKATHRSIIIRVTEHVYRDYINNGYTGECPTLFNFLDMMREQPEDEAYEISLALESFTNDSFSMFARPTNVDTNNRYICYNIAQLKNQLRKVGMLTMLDAIFNRVTLNAKKGRTTHIFFDEFHLLVGSPYTAEYLQTLWRTLRKFNAFCTGITQNIKDMNRSNTTRSIVSNSEIIVLLNQSPDDRGVIKELFNLSTKNLNSVTNSSEGRGLLRVSETIIPFYNNFPTNTELYALMTTKASEVAQWKKEQQEKADAENNG